MRPSIYFTVHDWMVKKMKLNGTNLLVMAFVYNYYSTLRVKVTKQDIMKLFDLSDRGARHKIYFLVDKGFIIKKKIPWENGFKLVYYPNTELITNKFL